MSLPENSHFNSDISNRFILSHSNDEGIWMMLVYLMLPCFIIEGWKSNVIEIETTQHVVISTALCSIIHDKNQQYFYAWYCRSLKERFGDCCELIGPENIGVSNANETSSEYSKLICLPYRVCARNVVENVLNYNSTSSIELIPVYMIIKLVQTFNENHWPHWYERPTSRFIMAYNPFCLLPQIFKICQFYQRQPELIQNITVAQLLQLSI